jgi:hypothetical protein
MWGSHMPIKWRSLRMITQSVALADPNFVHDLIGVTWRMPNLNNNLKVREKTSTDVQLWKTPLLHSATPC